LESLQKEIPKNVLPKDYGGNGMSIEELSGTYLPHFIFNDKYLLNLCCRVLEREN